MIRIAIIIKLEQDREQIKKLLSSEDDFQIINMGTNGYDALRAADTHPDIIMMNLQMPFVNGPELAPMLKRRSPSTALIVISSLNDEDESGWAFKVGISGYLLKEVDMDKLTASIRIVSNGGCYISTPIAAKILRHYSALAEISEPEGFTNNPRLPQFSPTELRIIDGIAKGFSDEEIAEILNVVSGTVRNSLAAAKRKTGLKNRTQMVLCALMFGLIKFSQIQEHILSLL